MQIGKHPLKRKNNPKIYKNLIEIFQMFKH